MSALGTSLADGLVLAGRNVTKIRRVPELLVGSTVAPIMFILLFAYVFGSAIAAPEGVGYREFLVPGIFVQTVIFGATITGAGLADDIQKGIVDRFRSLPIARSAVLVGRTGSDVVGNVLVMVVMSVTGLLVGWRIRDGVVEAVLGYALLLFFAYAFSWVMAWLGLLMRSPEAFNQLTFIVVFPVTFIANTFVPTNNFPSVLRVFADWNPVSSLALASRELFGNVSPAGEAAVPQAWSLQHPALYSLAWALLLLVVFVPLATRQYRRATSR
ncbi:ABC transporter permease [Quadrisphaera sp. DSM 44207]|uniref:ABC transporter permease n=1 Tax=Quadrisphaera sp. DSM 44207 TaxID=1881057 RepID=UPI0008925656|nr:ABC transporter permease [Quadrisphaera sp. DSM 44207]SDQ69325.1 ABC transporter efflux protein, DrrB family [Quadrisphaera sp. DSM 44207]